MRTGQFQCEFDCACVYCVCNICVIVPVYIVCVHMCVSLFVYVCLCVSVRVCVACSDAQWERARVCSYVYVCVRIFLASQPRIHVCVIDCAGACVCLD